MANFKLKYDKLPKTIAEQIELLKSRGLIIDDEDRLKYYLTNISYYHLSIYFKHFQREDVFREGTNFEDILKIYVFDNKLRLLLLEMLERVEKSFKCRMAYELSVGTGNAHCYLDKELFVNVDVYNEIIEMVKEEVKKSQEICIKHYSDKYSEPELPPIWNIVEILSFGQCIKICKSLRREYKNKISRTLGEDEEFIMSWVHCLSALRNNCAHHSRLWNRNLIFTPKMNHEVYGNFFIIGNKRLYNHLVALQILLSKINSTTSWLEKLKGHISDHNITVRHMGFPEDWEERLNEIMLINK